MSQNFDLKNIKTPVLVDEFEKLLLESNYPADKTEFLTKGFRNGFNLEYTGPRDEVHESANLPFTVGSPTELWNHVMKEVRLGRFAGPYPKPPFKFYKQSPIGLVPKDKGKKTRLIFHLSHPRGTDKSVNINTPKHKCSVQYPDFDEAVKLCLKLGKLCKIGKSDLTSAF